MNRKRQFLVHLVRSLSVIGGIFAAIPFVMSLNKRPGRERDYDLEVFINSIKVGESVSVNWLGRKIIIYHRTPSDIKSIESTDNDLLEDPFSLSLENPENIRNIYRAINKNYFVYMPNCTHLGCKVRFKPNREDFPWLESWTGGFHCPCHGSNYDLAGRVYKSLPAPKNLIVPAYTIKKDKIVIGINDDFTLS